MPKFSLFSHLVEREKCHLPSWAPPWFVLPSSNLHLHFLSFHSPEVILQWDAPLSFCKFIIIIAGMLAGWYLPFIFILFFSSPGYLFLLFAMILSFIFASLGMQSNGEGIKDRRRLSSHSSDYPLRILLPSSRVSHPFLFIFYLYINF